MQSKKHIKCPSLCLLILFSFNKFSNQLSSTNAKTRSWLGPNNLIDGSPPAARDNGYLLVNLDGYLYVFGGSSSTGKLCDKLLENSLCF